MKKTVMLSIRGRQSYMDQDPEIIELVTEGTLERCEDGWIICYQESNLTGLEGVTTTFRVAPGKIILTRTGKLNSEMVFQEGVVHESLYKVEFGALMLSVCASKINAQLDENGGTVELVYSIEIEQTAAGTIDYFLKIQPK